MVAVHSNARRQLMRYLRVCILSLMAMLLLSGRSQAAIVYDESVSGDLPDSFPYHPTFSFMPGSNLIKGNVGHDEGRSLDFDIFFFSIAPGDALLSASFTTIRTEGNV